MTQILTGALDSLWDAINHWPTLAKTFTRKFDLNDAAALLDDLRPAFSDLPAIRIVPLSTRPVWLVSRTQQWNTQFEITLWFADWNPRTLLNTVESLIDAIYRCCPEGSTVPYTQAAGAMPKLAGFDFAFGTLADDEEEDGTKVYQARVLVELNPQKDPLGTT